MAAPMIRAVFRKVVQIQAMVHQKPCSALLQHPAPAVFNSTVRLQSNNSPEQPKPTTKKDKSAAPPPATTDGKSYQSQEYYEYNEMSYYDLDSAMLKFRQTQPDPSKPSKP